MGIFWKAIACLFVLGFAHILQAQEGIVRRPSKGILEEDGLQKLISKLDSDTEILTYNEHHALISNRNIIRGLLLDKLHEKLIEEYRVICAETQGDSGLYLMAWALALKEVNFELAERQAYFTTNNVMLKIPQGMPGEYWQDVGLAMSPRRDPLKYAVLALAFLGPNDANFEQTHEAKVKSERDTIILKILKDFSKKNNENNPDKIVHEIFVFSEILWLHWLAGQTAKEIRAHAFRHFYEELEDKKSTIDVLEKINEKLQLTEDLRSNPYMIAFQKHLSF